MMDSSSSLEGAVENWRFPLRAILEGDSVSSQNGIYMCTRNIKKNCIKNKKVDSWLSPDLCLSRAVAPLGGLNVVLSMY